jgi:hypothetical protein
MSLAGSVTKSTPMMTGGAWAGVVMLARLRAGARLIATRATRPHVAACQQIAATSKLTLVRNGVILFGPNGSGRVDSTKIRGPPKRCTSMSALSSSGVDSWSTRGVATIALVEAQRHLRARRTRLERDVVDADASLLDHAVVVRADQLAVFGNAHLQHCLRPI